MKIAKQNGMTITEAASVLDVRKGEAISLAEAKFLTFINDGANGKAKTVTYESVFALKRSGGTAEALERIVASRTPDIRPEDAKPTAAQEAAPVTVTPVPGNVQISRSAAAIIEAVREMTGEVRQLRGILCQILKPKQQELALGQ